jgi:replicative DNA helicase
MKRTVLDNPGKVPQQKDFHDGEEINACADTIIMLNHERFYDDNAPKEELRVIVSRDRGKAVNRETVLHFDWERAMLMKEEKESLPR